MVVLVSPCYIVTAAHVVLGEDPVQRPGVDYTMIFRVGVGKTAPFAGSTKATLVVASERMLKGNDWALMKLNSCVGARAEFGWFESSNRSSRQLLGQRSMVVGYPTSNSRGMMMSGIGKVIAVDENSGNLVASASSINGQSGGPMLVFEDGQARVAGILAFQNRDLRPDHIEQNEYATYTRERANEFTAIHFVAVGEIRTLIAEDIAHWGRLNPNAERARGAVLR
jgi:V8-like Glu-specific endopeptidase